MPTVLQLPARSQCKNELLHRVDLLVARRNLQQRIRLNAHHVAVGSHRYVAGFDVVARTPASLAQVVEIPAADAGDSGPLRSAVAQVHVARLLAVGRSVAHLSLAVHPAHAHLGLKRGKAHHAANGVAAVHHAGRTKHDLSPFHCKRIQVDHVLYVPGAKNGGVHAHTVDRINQAVRGKAADHGASTALLAFLNKHFT